MLNSSPEKHFHSTLKSESRHTVRRVTLIMHVSRNTFQLEPVQRPNTREQPHCHSGHPSASNSDDGVPQTQLPHTLLTLSPRENNKLALKYENVERIRLCPDTRAGPTGIAVGKPLCIFLQHLYSARDKLDVIQQNIRFLTDEKTTLMSRILILEEKLTQEQSKNVKLKTLNENLTINLSAITTRALELSIDKQLLQDEAQRIIWHCSHNRFLLPLQNVTFYQKL